MKLFMSAVLMIFLSGLAAYCTDIQEPNPQQYLKSRLANGGLHSSTGEQYTWHSLFAAYDFLKAYEAFGKNKEWLDAAIEYYDTCIKTALSNDPDGYPGTFGAEIGGKFQGKVLVDTVVGDANIVQAPVLLADMIYNDPALKANPKYKKKADEYIALAEKMCWEKWNKRGCYYEDAHGNGSYHTYPFGIDKETKKWVPIGEPISDNLNKHYKMGLVMLRLWRITGKTEYRDRVIAIYGRLKSLFRYFKDEDRIVWNFWMPHGPYDIAGTAPRSWVAVHPKRPAYQVFEAGAIMEVYDSGLVFDKNDIERIVRTNRWMIDNGLQNADGTAKAGGIWGKLARLDDKIYAAYVASLEKGRRDVDLAYTKAEKAKNLGYKRKYVKDASKVIVSNKPVQCGEKLAMALAIPDLVETVNDDRIKLIAGIRDSGELQVDLLDSKGKVLGLIEKSKVDKSQTAYHTIRWDGTNPKSGKKDNGEYLVRWTLNGESRTTPVLVATGKKRAKSKDAVNGIAAGESLEYDFEKALDKRWKISGDASLSNEQAKAGKQSLKIQNNQSAMLVFGEEDDLPVKVEYWLYDGGVKIGKKNGEGPGWGIKTGDGNIFALFMKWRPYLNGDNELYWLNNGENQWFSPHRSGLKRTDGWSHYVMDFTKNPVEISKDGTVIPGNYAKPDKFIPKGGVAVVFLGTSLKGGNSAKSTIYIDDLKVIRK